MNSILELSMKNILTTMTFYHCGTEKYLEKLNESNNDP